MKPYDSRWTSTDTPTKAAGTRAVAAVTLVLLPACVLVLGSTVHFFVQRHEAKLDAAEEAKRQRFADFERRAEEKRKDAGRKRGAEMVEHVWRPLLRRNDLFMRDSRGRGKKEGASSTCASSFVWGYGYQL